MKSIFNLSKGLVAIATVTGFMTKYPIQPKDA